MGTVFRTGYIGTEHSLFLEYDGEQWWVIQDEKGKLVGDEEEACLVFEASKNALGFGMIVSKSQYAKA